MNRDALCISSKSTTDTIMAICSKRTYYQSQFRSSRLSALFTQSLRHSSTTANVEAAEVRLPTARTKNALPPASSPIDRLSTATLLRRLLMCTFLTSPLLYTPGLAVLRTIANSKSSFLNPDENRLLRRLIKPIVYDQFCAGTNGVEVHSTIADIKGLGFSGVVLCYAKEAQAESTYADGKAQYDPDLRQWRDGTLKTLDMIGDGDWLGIKVTGAGRKVMKALVQGEAPTSEYLEAIDAICAKAKKQGARLWVDAEQQAVQKSIDKWTIDLMRRWNRDSKPLIYNTIQSYLKESRPKLQYQLQLAQAEGWTLAVKLVRGAYIALDRDAIHSTKAETDASYEGIVRDLLQGTLPGFSQDKFPKIELLLAGHNPGTISRASQLAQELCKAGKLHIRPEFAQLQGMADDVGCRLLKSADEIRQSGMNKSLSHEQWVPRVYKCLTWGTIQECMQYLVRRAIENRGAADRIKDDAAMFAGELRKRIANTFRFRKSVE